MKQFLALAILTMTCAACSGDISSYEDALEAQTDIMKEMVGVLEGVNDQASAEKAADQIEALGSRLAKIAQQIQGLPKPSMEELEEFGAKQRQQNQAFQEKASAQMMKLAEYPVLTDAWMRAMTGMQ